MLNQSTHCTPFLPHWATTLLQAEVKLQERRCFLLPINDHTAQQANLATSVNPLENSLEPLWIRLSGYGMDVYHIIHMLQFPSMVTQTSWNILWCCVSSFCGALNRQVGVWLDSQVIPVLPPAELPAMVQLCALSTFIEHQIIHGCSHGGIVGQANWLSWVCFQCLCDSLCIKLVHAPKVRFDFGHK